MYPLLIFFLLWKFARASNSRMKLFPQITAYFYFYSSEMYVMIMKMRLNLMQAANASDLYWIISCRWRKISSSRPCRRGNSVATLKFNKMRQNASGFNFFYLMTFVSSNVFFFHSACRVPWMRLPLSVPGREGHIQGCQRADWKNAR